MKVNFLIFFLLVVLSNHSMAQPDDDQLEIDDINVIKRFEAKLKESERVIISPVIAESNSKSKIQNYANPFVPIAQIDYKAPTLRPIGIKSRKPPKSYDGYFRLGATYPKGVVAEANYGKRISNNFDLNFLGHYHAMDNSNNIDNQKYYDFGSKLEGTYYNQNGLGISGNLGFDSDKVHYYGYNNFAPYFDTIIEKQDVDQRFNTFSLGVNLFNGQVTKAEFNYLVTADAYFMRDLYASRENGFVLELEGTKYIGSTHPITINLKTDFTAYNDTLKQNLNNFFLDPSFTYIADRFRIKAGFSLANSDNEYHIFPDVEVLALLWGNGLSVFVGSNGSLYKQNYRNLTDYNPFLQTRIQLSNNKHYYFYGGLKGKTGKIEYRTEVGYKINNNLALYVPTIDDSQPYIQRFEVLYDSVNIISLNGDINYQLNKKTEIVASVSQSFYNQEKYDKPYHLPSLNLNLGTRYALLDNRLFLKGEIFLENGLPYIDYKGNNDNLNALFDVNLGAEYFFLENIGSFIQLNNLANNKRENWQNYPSYGLNIWVGISARF